MDKSISAFCILFTTKKLSDLIAFLKAPLKEMI